MAVRAFVDTNVLVYARDASEPIKQPRATEWLTRLWRERTGGLSIQVLQEYYVTVTRKLSPGLSLQKARADIRHLLAWKPIPVDGGVLEGAFMLQDRFGLSWWDSTIVSAARTGRFEILLTEDLQDGQSFDGILVVNPFRHPPAP